VLRGENFLEHIWTLRHSEASVIVVPNLCPSEVIAYKRTKAIRSSFFLRQQIANPARRQISCPAA
jgi:hypothetical protein